MPFFRGCPKKGSFVITHAELLLLLSSYRLIILISVNSFFTVDVHIYLCVYMRSKLGYINLLSNLLVNWELLELVAHTKHVQYDP